MKKWKTTKKNFLKKLVVSLSIIYITTTLHYMTCYELVCISSHFPRVFYCIVHLLWATVTALTVCALLSRETAYVKLF